MSGAREALLAHRAHLIARAESERQELAAAFGVYERPLGIVDRCWSIYRAIRSSSLARIAAAVGMAALAIVQPRSIIGWVMGGRAVWRLLGRARRRNETPPPA
jgi:hypothetical protein